MSDSSFTFGPSRALNSSAWLAESVASSGSRATAVRAAAEPAVTAGAEQETASPEYRAKAAAAAEKFEAHFIAQVLKQLRRSAREINADDERSFASRANDDMLEVADTFVADSLARQRAFGIADVILRQLLPTAIVAPSAGAVKDVSSPVASYREEPRKR